MLFNHLALICVTLFFRLIFSVILLFLEKMGYYIKLKTIDDLIISLDVEIARKSSVICEI